jgi:hypothetical protein
MGDIWEEKDLTKPEENSLNNKEFVPNDITNDIKKDSTENLCEDIGKTNQPTTLITRLVDGKTYWINFCSQCSAEMPYSMRSNFYHSRKIKKRCRSCANPMKRTEVSNKFRGDLNPSRRPEFRKWMSENNPMYNEDVKKRHLKSVNVQSYKDIVGKNWRENNPSKNKVLLEKRIDTYTKRLAGGKYAIKNNWKTGYYTRLDGGEEWYDSSYELKKMKQLDISGISWTKKHGIRIPYVNKNGVKTYYVPDFLVGGNSIEEIKGWIKENDEFKAKLGIEYCRNRGWSYKFYLGENLEYKQELSYERIS